MRIDRERERERMRDLVEKGNRNPKRDSGARESEMGFVVFLVVL